MSEVALTDRASLSYPQAWLILDNTTKEEGEPNGSP